MTWNLLVQILLPLVLVLTFVMVILMAKTVGNYEKMRNIALKAYDERKEYREKTVAQMETQMERLRRILDGLEQEERNTLGLSAFSVDDPASLLVWAEPEPELGKVAVLNDPHFLHLCQTSVRIFSEESAKTDFSLRLYMTVLNRSNLAYEETMVLDVLKKVAMWNTFKDIEPTNADFLAFQEDALCFRNARRLAKAVAEKVSGIRDSIVRVQTAVKECVILKALDRSLGELSPEEQTYYQILLNPKSSPEEYKRATTSWRNDVLSRLKDIYMRGYPLLEGV